MTDIIRETRVPENLQTEFENYLKDAGQEIIPSKIYDVPHKFDVSFLTEEKQQKAANTMLNYFVDYLKFPIIKDSFPTHKERQDWRNEGFNHFQREGGDQKADLFIIFLTRNKVRRNSIYRLFAEADLLTRQIKKTAGNDELLGRLANFIECLRPTMVKKETKDGEIKTRDPWDGPTTPEKIKQVDVISQAVLAMLNYFAVKEA